MTNPITRLESNARMAHVVVHKDVVYLAGAIATDLEGGIEQQMAETLADIDRMLALAGTDKSRLLTAQVWLKNVPRDFSAMNRAWESWLVEGHAPTRATAQVEMADPKILVEIIVSAATA